MEEKIIEEVISFVKEKTGLKNIHKETNIAAKEHQIFDIDAEFLMESFFEKFNVSYKGFDITQFFYYPHYSWKSIVFLKNFFNESDKESLQPLTINHLAKVVEKGIWFNP